MDTRHSINALFEFSHWLLKGCRNGAARRETGGALGASLGQASLVAILRVTIEGASAAPPLALLHLAGARTCTACSRPTV